MGELGLEPKGARAVQHNKNIFVRSLSNMRSWVGARSLGDGV